MVKQQIECLFLSKAVELIGVKKRNIMTRAEPNADMPARQSGTLNPRRESRSTVHKKRSARQEVLPGPLGRATAGSVGISRRSHSFSHRWPLKAPQAG